MRIAIVHSFYRETLPSGEDISVKSELDALRKASHDVQMFSAKTAERDLERPIVKARAGLRVATGYGDNPLPRILQFDPDIVHVHNVFPNISTSWIKSIKAPVVFTLRNYRPFCANGVLFRVGRVCTTCPDMGSSLPAVVHGCYRDSRLASIPLALASHPGWGRYRQLIDLADALIVLSPKSAEIVQDLGVPPGKVHLIPNHVPSLRESDREKPAAPPHQQDVDGFWIYAGRLSEEKGVMRLLDIWPRNEVLLIAGSGPSDRECRAIASARPEIRLVGQCSNAHLLNLISRSKGVIIPTLMYETFGRSYIEGLACGRPSIAAQPSAASAMIERDGTGRIFKWEEPETLSEALHDVAEDGVALRKHCAAIYEGNYSEQVAVRRLEALYRSLL